MKRRQFLIGFILMLSLALPVAGAERLEIHVPDLEGYKTLKCDFHMHTVFSDGQVWPTTRVDEAWREGLDAISITDHIEYLPHKADMKIDHNRPYEIALGAAKKKNILLVRGSEITRSTPPGHFNGIFLTDSKPLETPEFLDAIKAAHDQDDALVFWNHPGWKAKGEENYWFDIHTKLFDAKLVMGIEVANGGSYYKEAHQWCLDRNLTMFGNSDIHKPADPPTATHAKHRTMTLVFAKERTIASLREAMVGGRTVVWYSDQLIGKEEFLKPLFLASVKVGVANDAGDVVLRNTSDVPFALQHKIKGEMKTVELPAQGTLKVTVGKRPALKLTVTNLLVAPGKGLVVSLKVGKAAE